MSNEHGGDETTVFASAKPVSPTDLVDNETEASGETKTPKAEGRTKAEVKTTGVPPWHLSAALGLTLALIGGVVLWMQSPLLAVIVIGGLVVLVGLGLALRHFFRGETAQQRRAARSQGSTTSGSPSRSQSPGGSQARSRRKTQDQHPETGPTRRRPWSRQRSRDRETGDQPQSRRRFRRSQPDETGGRTRSQPQSRRQSPDRTRSGPQAPTGPRGNGGRPPGVRTPQTLVNPGNQGPRPPRDRSMIPGTSGPRVPENQPPRPLTGKTPEPSKPDAIDPPKIKKKKGDKKDVVTKDIPTVAPEKKSQPEEPMKTVSKMPDIAWPNVDLDHYKPVQAHNLPRITVPRRAKRLPPIYHRMGEPSWPTDDPDKIVPPIPDQRRRGNHMTTVDMLSAAQRDARLASAAATAQKLAQDKTTKAHEFLALGQRLEGMEGMETRREEHLLDAQRAAHDAAVREAMAHIYESLRRK